MWSAGRRAARRRRCCRPSAFPPRPSAKGLTPAPAAVEGRRACRGGRQAPRWGGEARSQHMKASTILLVVVLAAMLAFAVWGLFAAWSLSGDTAISVHGYIALGLAGGMTLLLGGGLMWLAFYSSRKGYDDIDRD